MSARVVRSANPAPTPVQRDKKKSCSLVKVLLGLAVGVALIAYGAGQGVFSVRRDQIPTSDPRCAPGILKPYVGGDRLRPPEKAGPDATPQMVHPGQIQLKSDPKMGYAPIEGQFGNHDRTIGMVKGVYQQVKNHPSLIEDERSSRAIDNGPFLIVAQDRKDQRKISCLYAMTARLPENHKDAALHAKKWVQKLGELSASQICSEILTTHQKLMKGVTPRKIGQFRREFVIVFKDNQEEADRSPAAMMALIKKRGGTDKEAELYKTKILKKIAQNLEEFTPQELKVLRYLAYVPPASKDVPQLMEQYARKLKTMAIQMKACEEFDPIAFAAYAHMELGRIHPFEEGNGRMSRLMMNAILTEAGYQAVVFPSDEEYTDAVNRDTEEPGYFAKYLRETAIPWVERELGSQVPCLEDFTCASKVDQSAVPLVLEAI